MAAKKNSYKRKRKPVILLVCEGRNKTERLYFEHFKERNSPYSLVIRDSEATDCMNMAKKADRLFSEYQMDKTLGDHAFCLIDIDLKPEKEKALSKAKAKYKNIEFIVSNPCFEIWLMYYFTPNPPVRLSSQAVKDCMCNFVPEYDEAMDVVEKYSLKDKYAVAINNSEKKNMAYEGKALVDRNPYTEVQDLVLLLTEIN